MSSSFGLDFETTCCLRQLLLRKFGGWSGRTPTPVKVCTNIESYGEVNIGELETGLPNTVLLMSIYSFSADHDSGFSAHIP